MHGIIGRKSQLSLESNIQLYKDAKSNIWIFQISKIRSCLDALYCVANEVIHDIPVQCEVQQQVEKTSSHPNVLTKELNVWDNMELRQLKRYQSADLTRGTR